MGGEAVLGRIIKVSTDTCSPSEGAGCPNIAPTAGNELATLASVGLHPVVCGASSSQELQSPPE